MLKHFVFWLIAFFMTSTAWPMIPQEAYFPEDVLADNSWKSHFKTDWYSRELRVLEEPSLFGMAKNYPSESYRFLWIRTFHHPIAIRLEIRADGVGILTIKVASGTGGFAPGHLVENASRPLSLEQTRAFLALTNKTGIWLLPGNDTSDSGLDGSQWIIEGVKKGENHVVDRWSPDEGPVCQLGLTLAIGLANMNFSKNELY